MWTTSLSFQFHSRPRPLHFLFSCNTMFDAIHTDTISSLRNSESCSENYAAQNSPLIAAASFEPLSSVEPPQSPQHSIPHLLPPAATHKGRLPPLARLRQPTRHRQ